MKDARPQRGFTLIEVLVALIIVAFGMSAVFVSLTSAANSTMRLREKSFAEWVGFNQLSTVRLNGSAPLVGRSAGDATFAGIRWHCLQTVENMDVPGLLRITIQVRYADAKSGQPVGSQGDSRPGSALAGSASGGGNAQATSRCIDPTASLASAGGDSTAGSLGSAAAVSSSGTSVLSGAADGASGATWIATVVGFYGVGALLTAPQGLLIWDAAANANGATAQTPGGAPVPGTATVPTGAPVPAPNPGLGPGLP